MWRCPALMLTASGQFSSAQGTRTPALQCLTRKECANFIIQEARHYLQATRLEAHQAHRASTLSSGRTAIVFGVAATWKILDDPWTCCNSHVRYLCLHSVIRLVALEKSSGVLAGGTSVD